MSLKYKKVSASIKASKQGKDVIFKGYANPYTVDDCGDLMDPLGCITDRYDLNPIVLFNHDRDFPVGKSIKLEKRPNQGLWVEGKMSNSEAQSIMAIRDLVEEEILVTLSIGYNEDESVRQADGVNLVTKWTLHEISIVTVPMNMGATISVSKCKAFNSVFKEENMGSKVGKEHLKEKALMQKGAWVASAVHKRISQMIENGGFDRDAALKEIAKEAGCSDDELKDIMAGNISPVPENCMKAIAKTLGMDIFELQKLNDKKPPAPPVADPEKPGEPGAAPAAADPKEPPAAPPAADPKEPKPDVKPEVKPGEGEDDPKKPKEPKAAPAVPAAKATATPVTPVQKSVQDCVREKIPKLIEEGHGQDQAVAIAISMCNRESGKACEYTMDDYKSFFAVAESATQKVGNSALANAGAPKKSSEPVQTKQASPDPTAPNTVITSDTDPNNFGNPQMELMKQQIVLLGTIANKLDLLLQHMQGSPQGQPPAAPAPAPLAPAQAPEPGKALDSGVQQRVKQMQDQMSELLTKLGF